MYALCVEVNLNIIHCADLHLRPDRPLCRKDIDWMQTQKDVLDFIVQTANQFKADITIGGDVFDSPRTSPAIVHMFIEAFSKCNKNVYVIAGNHSLLYHNQDNLMESSIGILSILDSNIKYLSCQDNSHDGIFEHFAELDEIALIHSLVFPEEVPFGAKGQSYDEILLKYPHKYILLGDYHRYFYFKKDGRFIINPGCTTIQSADMLDYKPVVVHISDIDITPIELPNDVSVLTDNHIQEKKERDERIASFISTVKKHGKLSLSFEDNLRKAIKLNDVSDDIIKIIEELEE